MNDNLDRQINTGEIEIDLSEIIRILITRWKLLTIAFVGVAVVVSIACYSFVAPQYESTAKLFVLSKSTSVTSLADIQVGTSLTSDYEEIINSRPVLEKAINGLGLTLQYDELSAKLSVSNPTDTRILVITIRDSDPYWAKKVVDEIATVSAEFIADRMDQDPPSIIQSGYADGDPVSPRIARDAIIGGIIGLALAIAFVLGSYFMHDTIETVDDAEKKLGINILGSLPFEEELENAKGKQKRGKNGSRKSKKIRKNS